MTGSTFQRDVIGRAGVSPVHTPVILPYYCVCTLVFSRLYSHSAQPFSTAIQPLIQPLKPTTKAAELVEKVSLCEGEAAGFGGKMLLLVANSIFSAKLLQCILSQTPPFARDKLTTDLGQH